MKQNNLLVIVTAAIIVILILIIWMLFRLNKIEKEITESIFSSLPLLNEQPLTKP